MLKNYLKIALRNMSKYKFYTFINVSGLATGIASVILIFLFVQNELTFDAFHKNADDIYLVQKYRTTALGLKVLNDTWIPLAKQLKTDYPQVKDCVRLFDENLWVEYNGKKFKERITYADPSILKVFSFPVVQSNTDELMKERNSIVISDEIAKKYFGNENPVGKILRIAFDEDYVVKGVFDEIPQNSSIPMNILAHFESAIDPSNQEMNNNWNGAFLYTYIQLDKNVSAAGMENLLPGLVKKIWGEEGENGTKQLQLKLLPLKDFHDAENNTRTFAYILICIAAAIILIASFNFINLSTSRSLERVREIGIRKVLGAGKNQLIKQFIGESLIVSFISLLIGIGLAEFLLPYLNEIYSIDLAFNYLHVDTLIVLLGISIFIGLLSGAYPAFLLSKYPAVDTVKGVVIKSGGNTLVRNSLVIVQFAISIFLLIGTLIVLNQTEHMKNHNVNFTRENIVVIPVELSDFADRETARNKIELFKEELKKLHDVKNVASAMSVPGEIVDANVFAWPEGWTSKDPLRMRITAIDENFISLYQIPLIEGRNFSQDMQTDKDAGIILNESAMTAMGWQSAMGKKVKVGRTEYTVVGVVRDYNTESLENEVRPLLHFYRTTESSAHRFISVKINTADVSSVISFIKSKWKLVDESRDFEYFFLDETFNRLFSTQERTFTVVSYFSIIAVVIACLGLLGLASYTVVRRSKEIGIRKILGATVPNIFLLVSKKFLLLVLTANLVAWPVAWYLMNEWLQNFAYRTSVNFTPFIIAGVMTLLIAWISISFIAVRAAMTNPVESLRYE
ncbi:MAG: ABC transporter permease [Ignavibacteriales bacterium]|nr:MAG: ABC transporter permease [Ignavibacteriales bacterium]